MKTLLLIACLLLAGCASPAVMVAPQSSTAAAKAYALDLSAQSRPAVAHFARCAREDLRRLIFHVRGILRSIRQRSTQ